MKTRYRDQRGLPVVDALGQDVRFGVARPRARPRIHGDGRPRARARHRREQHDVHDPERAHHQTAPLPDASRVIYVSTRDVAGTDRGLSWPEFATCGRGGFDGARRLRRRFRQPGERARGAGSCGAQLCRCRDLYVLSIQPFLGRSFTDDDAAPGGPPVAILSEGIWRRIQVRCRPARPDRAGRWLPTTVVGVIAAAVGLPLGR